VIYPPEDRAGISVLIFPIEDYSIVIVNTSKPRFILTVRGPYRYAGKTLTTSRVPKTSFSLGM
jgi:hypothetical protein